MWVNDKMVFLRHCEVHQKCGSERVNVLHKYLVMFMHENFENSKRHSERFDVKQLIMSYTKTQMAPSLCQCHP